MPLGAFLTPDERVLSGEAIQAAEQAATFPPEADAITRTAQQYFEGTSYFWGGVTPWGADCSGLVQSVYWLHGIQLHRDAWQQSTQGVAGEPNPIDALAGDLLFFSDRVDHHITHVAISLGGGCLVHLALGRGGYAIERLDDDARSVRAEAPRPVRDAARRYSEAVFVQLIITGVRDTGAAAAGRTCTATSACVFPSSPTRIR